MRENNLLRKEKLMKILKRNKGVIIFYLVIIAGCLILSEQNKKNSNDDSILGNANFNYYSIKK